MEELKIISFTLAAISISVQIFCGYKMVKNGSNVWAWRSHMTIPVTLFLVNWYRFV